MEWIGIILGYLLGSIPSAVWTGKLLYHTDVRDHGSRNAGATNTFRVLGRKTGIFVLIMDILKGWAAIAITEAIFHLPAHDLFLIFTGLAAVLGHIFPLMAGFRGGKGIATLAGISIALFPFALLVSLIVFLLVFLLTRYVSLASILASLALPIASYFIAGNDEIQIIILTILIAILVPLTHHKNIRRLIKRTESKISLNKKT